VLALGLIGACVALFVPRSPARLVVGVVAVGLLGIASMQRALDGLVHSSLTAPRDARASATISATLVDDPDGTQYNAKVLVRVRQIDGRHAGSRTVLVTAGGDAASRLRLLETGDEVELSGWLQPLSGFDTRLQWRHAVARFDAVELVAFEPAGSPLHRTANALRAHVLAGGRYLPATERALMAGFLLGDTRSLPRDVAEQFRAAGLTHLLAVSGDNVAQDGVFAPGAERQIWRVSLGYAAGGADGRITRGRARLAHGAINELVTRSARVGNQEGLFRPNHRQLVFV
jgi:competence protein ComEC